MTWHRMATFAATPGIAVLDADGRLLEWNAEFERELAASACRPGRGLRLAALDPAADGAAEAPCAAAGHRACTLDRNGRRFRIEEVELPSGTVVRTSREILGETGSGDAGRILQSLALQTSGSVSRLRRAAQEEPRCARAEAERANEAKNSFLATMSHEMRTPLNGLLGMLELLHGSDLSPEQSAWAEAASLSGESLRALIDDVMDLTRAEGGQVDLRPAPFDLVELLEEAATLVAARAARKGLLLSVFVAPELRGSALGDARRLRQILFNLAGNAVKFTDAGSVSVEALPAAAPQDAAADRRRVRFQVLDSGSGLRDRDTDRLCERFVQADPSITQRFGGFDLGLAICREFVSLMGGRIGLERRPCGGTLAWFEVDLPPVGTPRRWDLSDEDEPVRVLLAGRTGNADTDLLRHLRALDAEVAEAPDIRMAVRELAEARTVGAPCRVVFVDAALAARAAAHGAALSVTLRAAVPGETRLVLLADPATTLQAPCPDWADGVLARPIRLQPLLDCLRRTSDSCAMPGIGLRPTLSAAAADG
ncbi:ATP-binding protein [Marinibaculum pumilum]|uniref:histidine kinase n=1 Tax=Marinibaculum pumilum TaxID=1766165 RepID=A0ABV7L7E0_9PROT